MSQRYAPEPYDVITMGRIGVDLYPLRTGVPLAKVDVFGKFLGGSATNVAVGAARLGRRTAVITRTGADAFGDYLHDALREFGVDDRWVTAVAGLPTPVTFCEIFPPDNFPLWFYRQPKAPDLELRMQELDLAAIGAARVFWMTGTGLSEEPSRSTTLAALAHRDRLGITVFDLDWRPMFWRDPDEARPYYRQALAGATVAVGNLDECEIATGERDPAAAAKALLAAGVELAVVKQGSEGVLALHRDGTRAEVPPVPVDVVNGLGAGDAFGGALCHGLLAGWELGRVMRYANAAGAVVAARLACSTAMPYPAEVEQVLSGGPVPPSPTPPPDAPDAPKAPDTPNAPDALGVPVSEPASPRAPAPVGTRAEAGERRSDTDGPAQPTRPADPQSPSPADPGPQADRSPSPGALSPPPTDVSPTAPAETGAPAPPCVSAVPSAPVPPAQDRPSPQGHPDAPRAPSTARSEDPGGRS